MKPAKSVFWPLSHPPTFPIDPDIEGEALFRAAIEKWLEEALRAYLPQEVLCLVPAPLLPDSTRMDLPIPYLGRPDMPSRKAIARFGAVSSVFRESGASLFRGLHEAYGDSKPAVVLLRQACLDGAERREYEIANFCVLAIPECVGGYPSHPGDDLADSFAEKDGLLRIPSETFTIQPDVVLKKPVTPTVTGNEKIGEIVHQHLSNYPYYAPTFAPILPCAQVVMVLARSIHSADWKRRRGFGAGGVTFLLKTGFQITSDLMNRLCAVVQHVDGLLGSLHFATQDVVRLQTAAEALSILKHSVGNQLGNIAALSPEAAPHIGPHITVLRWVLEGAVSYARQRGSPIVEDGRTIPWKNLGYGQEPFDQTLRRVLWQGKPLLEFSVTGMEDGELDSRAIVLIEELARNLSKGPEDKPGLINIKCNPTSGIGEIQVSGWGTTWDLARMVRNIRGIKPQSNALSLRGMEAVVRISSALQFASSFTDFALGEWGINRRQNLQSPDIVNQELHFKLWDQDFYDQGQLLYRPFLAAFTHLKLLVS